MEEKKYPKHIQQKINILLEQLVRELPLNPSNHFLEAVKFALVAFIEQNIWVVPVTFESLFLRLVEFGNLNAPENAPEEIRRVQKFSNLLIKKYPDQFKLFSARFYQDLNYYINDKVPAYVETPRFEINEDAKSLLSMAGNLAMEVFHSEILRGEHLIFCFFSPEFSKMQKYLEANGINKEELLFEWVKSMRVSDEELGQWQKAFNYIHCNVDIASGVLTSPKEKQIASHEDIQGVAEELKEQSQKIKMADKDLENVVDTFKEKSKAPPQHIISLVLEKFKKSLPVPPSNFVLHVFERSFRDLHSKRVWPVFISLRQVFISLVEFFKSRKEKSVSMEMTRSRSFVKLFLREYQSEYSRIFEGFIEQFQITPREFENSKSTSDFVLDGDAQKLFETASYLAVEVFGLKEIKAEHLILAICSPRFYELEKVFIELGIAKEELLYEWVKSLSLNNEDLKRWEYAFQHLECDVPIDRIIAEKNRNLAETEGHLYESRSETNTFQEDDKDESVAAEELSKKKVAYEIPKAERTGVDREDPEVAKTSPEGKIFSSLVISREELGRTPARADEPANKVEDDLLGRDHLVEAIAEMVADEKQGTPFTIGLLGNWGSGKSTVMKMLQDALKNRDDRERFEFSEFNAWEYERTSNLEAGLAQEVIRGLVDPLTAKEKGRVKVEFVLKEHGLKAKVLLSLIGIIVSILLSCLIGTIYNFNNWIILNFHEGYIWPWLDFFEGLYFSIWGKEFILGGFTLLTALGTFCKKLSDHPLSVELDTYLKLPNYGKHLGLIPVLKKHIKFLCKIRLGTAKERNFIRKDQLGAWGSLLFKKEPEKDKSLSRRLIVFIDDLDRCDPDSITKTLDAVRLVMDVKNVFVVIGIDHRIALRAVGDHYKKLADGQHSAKDIARDYLGKILQLVIVLNQPTDDELKTFVQEGLFPETIIMKKDSGVVEGEKEKDFEEAVKELLEDKAELVTETDEKKFETSTSSDNLIGEAGSLKKNLVDKENSIIEEEKEENLWRKEIEFSTDESELFAELAVTFELRNPRQLLRLRNSYGLLKLLYGIQNAVPFTPFYKDSLSEEGKVKLMILLFWKEFEANHLKWGQQVKEYLAGRLNTSETSLDPIVYKIADRMSKSDIGGLNFSFTGLTATADFVERFVLPRSDGLDRKSGSQPAG